MHAEPWDKLVSVANGGSSAPGSTCVTGEASALVVDREIGPDTAVFVPRGVANGYQTARCRHRVLLPGQRPLVATGARLLHLRQPRRPRSWRSRGRCRSRTARCPRPTSSTRRWARLRPCPRPTPLVLGGNGQVGRALRSRAARADLRRPDDPRPTRADAVEALDLRAARRRSSTPRRTPRSTPPRPPRAAGTPGRPTSRARRRLVDAGPSAPRRPGARLLATTSSTARRAAPEDEPLSPLGVYGQTKAAGDAARGTCQRHYIVRTSWVVGEARTSCARCATWPTPA